MNPSSEKQQPSSPSVGRNPDQLYPIPVYSFSPRLGSSTNLPDYDDLPTDHKPILPPKVANLSTSHLGPIIDPVQLELHKRIMSKSATNIPTIQKIPSTYNTMQVHKPSQNHLKVQEQNIPGSHENSIENKKGLLNTVEPIPLPKKANTSRKQRSDESIKKEEFEDYDLPVVKHRRPNDAINESIDVREEYEDYDEPIIKHSLHTSAISEFEDYDQPVNSSKVLQNLND